jgi:glyoxylase-like metal-dependent hydrolase (beta-lactamase superfamily II)
MRQFANPRTYVAVLLVALAVLVGATGAVGQQRQGAPFSTAIMKIKDGLYVIPGYDGAATGGNVAVRVTTEGVIVVDSKLTALYSDIVDKVKSVSPQPIKYILNTHQHFDHTGSNAQFLKTAEILMHRNARANMITGNLPGPGRIVYSDQQSVFLGGVEVQMRYMGRGHTNGDSVIYFPDLRTVHTGDLVVWGKRSQGTTLTPNMDYAEGHGSGKEWVATISTGRFSPTRCSGCTTSGQDPEKPRRRPRLSYFLKGASQLRTMAIGGVASASIATFTRNRPSRATAYCGRPV